MKTYIGTPREIYSQFTTDGKGGQFDLDKQYKCEIRELKGGKTDAQRSRYWVLVREYAKKVGVSQYEIHNRQLADLGIRAKDSNGDFIVELHGQDYEWEKDKYNHLQPTSHGIKTEDGVKRVFYRLKHSEDMTTEEFSQLMETIMNNIIQDGLDNEIDINYLGE